MSWFDERLYLDVGLGYAQRFEVSRVVCRRRTAFQDLLIFESPAFGRVLALDGVVQTTEKDEPAYHEMMVHVPLFAHGRAKDVLIIGAGDGGILREVLRHPGVERATMVEIDGGVIEACREHMPALSAGAFEDKRANVIVGDGIDFVAKTERRFDAIVSDSTDPIGPGEVLFSSAFYADCRRVLKPGGVFVAQNGVPNFQPAEVTTTYRRLTPIFKDVGFYLTAVATYIGGFMSLAWASDDPALRQVPIETLRERFAAAKLTTRYYTPEVHRAAFALPAYVRDLVH